MAIDLEAIKARSKEDFEETPLVSHGRNRFGLACGDRKALIAEVERLRVEMEAYRNGARKGG